MKGLGSVLCAAVVIAQCSAFSGSLTGLRAANGCRSSRSLRAENNEGDEMRSCVSFSDKSAFSTAQTGSKSVLVPDPDSVFNTIQQVSPLAVKAMTGRDSGEAGGSASDLKWKMLEKSRPGAKRPMIIDKIDNYDGGRVPLLRFKTTVRGPHNAERYASLIMSTDLRTKWDPACKSVEEILPLNLEQANHIYKDYGITTRLGCGHCITKPAAAGLISPREQLTICGISEFHHGSIIWGFECNSDQDYLFPPSTPRLTRSSSRLFSTALVPNEDGESFDVEYVLQLDVGGKIPLWATQGVISTTVKSLFNFSHKYFGPGGGVHDYVAAETRLEELRREVLGGKEDVLLTM